MNAYFELFGSAIPLKQFEELNLKEDAYINFGSTSRVIKIAPTKDSDIVRTYVKNILWAKVSYEYFDDEENNSEVILKSTRAKEDEDEFINWLLETSYNEGYGIQHLFGTIVFKDNTWMTRGEYDGSEWWEFHTMPKEPNWEKQ